MRKLGILAVAMFAYGCGDGPHEDAGERLDALRGETGGKGSIIAGPAEKRGEKLDQMEAEARHRRSEHRH